MKLSFILKRLRDANIRGFIDTAKEVSAINGKPWPAVLADMLSCTNKYGSGRVDYITFEMYNMTDEERAKILTIGKNNELIKRFNNLDYAKYFDDKALFNQHFNKYLKREWMLLDGKNEKEFIDFTKDKEAIIIKPLDLSCGKGIEKMYITDDIDLSAEYKRLYEAKKFLIEEVVIQDDEMSKLCSTSVNTVRLITIVNNGKPHVVAGAVRMGREGNYVDNFDFGGYEANIGGLAATLDTDNGIIVTDPIDKHRNVYHELPVLGTVAKGFKIPHYEEAVALVKEASTVIPQMAYVGWDVAISKDHGPLLIEGNNFPAQDFIQIPKLGIGTYEAFMKKIDE